MAATRGPLDMYIGDTYVGRFKPGVEVTIKCFDNGERVHVFHKRQSVNVRQSFKLDRAQAIEYTKVAFADLRRPDAAPGKTFKKAEPAKQAEPAEPAEPAQDKEKLCGGCRQPKNSDAGHRECIVRYFNRDVAAWEAQFY